ncbi:hypothetical protein [Streptomyces sp. NBC_01373]|nr:hypothetical protein [Streptomyces sp. NBC_01373]MCX4703897.1 hypothetical protein [Streptomyces sp. NBC_01373]
MSSVAPCSSKGRPGSVRVVKGGRYECVRCGRQWPMSLGSSHPA